METGIPPQLWLRTILAKNNVSVSDQALGLLEQYVQGLIQANRAVNLISRRDEENIWQHHILHSLSILFQCRFRSSSRVLDLGSGGGLPGVPLKIMVPDMVLMLLDSTRKKMSAVGKIVADLKLENVHPVWGRAEDLGRDKKFVGQFDVVLARAVGPLDNLARLAHPFLKALGPSESAVESSRDIPMVLENPSLVAYKGGPLEAELDKARRIRYVRSVRVKPIVFEGSQTMGLEDKKLVIIQFT
jgi:16S rRNA (guanine527-N7)-methyltransferase